jgi:hypothetical protein
MRQIEFRRDRNIQFVFDIAYYPNDLHPWRRDQVALPNAYAFQLRPRWANTFVPVFR